MDQFSNDRTASRRRKRRRALLAVLLASSVATLGAGAMSLAVFTDGVDADGSWTTGTIILGVTPTTTFTATDILPGDSGTRTVAVKNNGTGELRYSLTGSATNADGKGLAAEMTLSVKAGACPGAGAALYNGALGSADFGDPAQGDDTGDRVVAAGATDNLCFRWDFPLASGNGFQDAATDATFTFDAEQTANNP